MKAGWALPLPLTIGFFGPVLREPRVKRSRAPLARSQRQHRLRRSLADLAEVQLVPRVHRGLLAPRAKDGLERSPKV